MTRTDGAAEKEESPPPAAASDARSTSTPRVSAHQRVVDPAKYRTADRSFGTCAHGSPVVLCSTSGKVGRNGRSAAIGATLFWLTCPALNNVIARLERHGAVAQLSMLLEHDDTLRAAHVDSHAEYEAAASRLLPAEQAAFFRDQFARNPDESKRKYGNAAVGHPADMKCLHALVAQTLAGCSNPIGNLCLHYLMDRMETVRGLSASQDRASVEHEPPSAASSARAAGAPNPAVCSVIDDPVGLSDFLCRKGHKAVCAAPPVLASGEPNASACCEAAQFLTLAAEGHLPRTRKKRRKN